MGSETRPITILKGVGPNLAAKLERLGWHTVQDVLFHLPFRYEDRTRVTPVGSLRPGQAAVVLATIEAADVAYRRRRMLLCQISDGTGSLILRFFHFSGAQQNNLARGRTIRCYGEVRAGPKGLEMVHPEYEFVEATDTPVTESHLTPVYPTTEGVHQLTVRKFVAQALDRFLDGATELLPQAVLDELALPDLKTALRTVHRPQDMEDLALLEAGDHPAQQRLAFEELLAHHLSLLKLRARTRRQSAPAMTPPADRVAALRQSLPFPLTGAQERVVGEIAADLCAAHPMHRLVQGDVGSGKTVVAALAAMQAVESNFQVAIMAPTELLAEQHAANFHHWLEPLDLRVVSLSGKLRARERQHALEAIGTGAPVVVGTHALFQQGVEFAHLGLVIVDEQHRFGVHQRLALREKGSVDGRVPHQLIMTATPIPRTLAQTVYADLDVSIIDELPPGRTPVETVAVPDSRRAEVVQRVRAAAGEGRQVYWICPLIEESETLQLQTATDTELALREALPALQVSLVHGRMKPADKEAVMSRFKAREIDVLVATTVIEVGVDVPNASLMIIENSERLGLSQLHQLRGRVGRSTVQSSCVLLYQSPLGALAKQRLAAMRETNDGFEIARRDLELRGPGELLGTRQTGAQAFHIADIVRDQRLLPRVQAAARILQEQYPDRVEPVIQRWIARAEEYAHV
ncbi:MAG: ATP-dependent DNA helicase RecG [Acidiferrobacteraceae bacterium]|jgi:ATP-dependent DNA helicase RecG